MTTDPTCGASHDDHHERAATPPRVRVEIDLNVRTRGTLARVGFEDADSPLQPGQHVEVYESESGLTGAGTVTAINPTDRLAWIAVEWAALDQRSHDTPGCDCDHDGMGVGWHANDCAWKADQTKQVGPDVADWNSREDATYDQPTLIRAPWTPEQVEALNRFQSGGGMHPFTCGADHGTNLVPLAHADGWHCSEPSCDYRQDWALAFMADPGAWPKQLLAPGSGARCTCGGVGITHFHADRHEPTELGTRPASPNETAGTVGAATITIPLAAFDQLVKVAAHVSLGRSAAFSQGPYPDATARFGLGALDEAGLLDGYRNRHQEDR